MHQRKRIYYSETQKSLMWDRWQRGESLQKIAGLFDRHHSAIAGVLIRSGGNRPPHGVVHHVRCGRTNERRYRVVWLQESRFVRLPWH